LAVSQGAGAEEAQLPYWLHRPQEARVPRHPAELDLAHRGLHGAQGEHAHHQLPAALPSARKAMQVEAILPNGTNQIVSYVGNFNFSWMTNYIYDDDAAPVFPKGTIIHVSSWYDNTKANKSNPDPDQWVGYGD